MSLKQQTIQALTKRIWFGTGGAIDWPMPNEMMGIELEAENVRNAGGEFLNMAGWTVDNDGSLRNSGREFVLTQPLSGTALTRAVHTLFAMQQPDSSYRLTYTPNPRAGTHIHINWLDDTVGAAAAMIALMYCIEPLVYGWADEDRAWCSYCNPLSDIGASTLSSLLDLERERPEDEDYEDNRWLMREINSDSVGRYHGLNIVALSKYGTLEFRYFPSTNKQEDMVAWIKFVQLAKLCALKYQDDVTVLLNRLAEGKVAEFLLEHFNVDQIATGLLTGVNDADLIVSEKATELLTIMDVRPVNAERYGVGSPAARRYLQQLGGGTRHDVWDEVMEEPEEDYRVSIDRPIRARPQMDWSTPMGRVSGGRVVADAGPETYDQFMARQITEGLAAVEQPVLPTADDIYAAAREAMRNVAQQRGVIAPAVPNLSPSWLRDGDFDDTFGVSSEGEI